MDAYEKLRLALLKILNFNKLRIFGCLIYNFKIRISNIRSEFPPKINTALAFIDNGQPTIILFEDFVNELKVSDLIFVLIHEILHIINGHTYRRGSRNKILYNLAADHVINKSIITDIKSGNLPKITIPDSHFSIPELMNSNYNVGEVYKWLEDQAKIIEETKHTLSINDKSSNGSGEEASTSEETPEDETSIKPTEEETSEETAKEETSENDISEEDASDEVPEKDISEEETIEDDDSDETSDGSEDEFYKIDKDDESEDTINVTISEVMIKNKKYKVVSDLLNSTESVEKDTEIVNELVSEIRTLMKDERISRGLASGSIKELIDKIIEVNIPWEDMLARGILTKIVPSPDTRIWTRPHKRLRSHGIILPGQGYDKKPDCAILLIDTSGSISNKDLKKFSNIIVQSLSQFDEIRVIKHDTKIHSDEKVLTSDITNNEIISEFKGRGGTCHRECFDRIEKSFLDKEDIGLVITLTDFDSNMHIIYKKYEWTKRIPICICITGYDAENKVKKVPQELDPNPIVIKEVEK